MKPRDVWLEEQMRADRLSASVPIEDVAFVVGLILRSRARRRDSGASANGLLKRRRPVA